MKTALFVYLVTIVISYIIHKIVGYFLIRKLKNENRYDIYLKFDEKEKRNRTFINLLKIKIIFFIPIVNLMISIIEIVNYSSTYTKLLKELNNYEKFLNKKEGK